MANDKEMQALLAKYQEIVGDYGVNTHEKGSPTYSELLKNQAALREQINEGVLTVGASPVKGKWYVDDCPFLVLDGRVFQKTDIARLAKGELPVDKDERCDYSQFLTKDKSVDKEAVAAFIKMLETSKILVSHEIEADETVTDAPTQ